MFYFALFELYEKRSIHELRNKYCICILFVCIITAENEKIYFCGFRECREIPLNVGLYGNFRGGEKLRQAIARTMERTFMGVKVFQSYVRFKLRGNYTTHFFMCIFQM